MSNITIQKWKEVDQDGSDFTFIDPQYRPNYWAIPRWWYKGDRTVYESCVRIDGPEDSSIYIDATTPLMEITLSWDGTNLTVLDARDIVRMLICNKDDLGAINRGETEEYTDIEFTPNGDIFIRKNDFVRVPVFDPVVITTDPSFDPNNVYEVGMTITAYAGDFTGGPPNVNPRTRYQVRATAEDSWINKSWQQEVSAGQPHALTLEAGTGQIRFQYQVRNLDDETNTNKFSPVKTVTTPTPPAP